MGNVDTQLNSAIGTSCVAIAKREVILQTDVKIRRSRSVLSGYQEL